MKRVLSGAIIFALVLIIFLLGNIYITDIALFLVAIICINELFHAFEQKNYHPIKWVAYVATIIVAIIHVIPSDFENMIIKLIIPTSIALSFIHLMFNSKKINIMDIIITLFGIIYIVMFLNILIKIVSMERGNLLIWYVFISAWVTDVCALYTGKTIGKHHFTQISPNKTIEGCIGGAAGAVIFTILYTIILNKFAGFNINYAIIGIVALLLSVIGQIGDLIASSIKRYCSEKDFSNLIPGHGGMLDRIDSIIFIAPFAYILLLNII